MKIFDERIINLNEKEAKVAQIDTINIGLGYTAVILKDGRCGLCCTLLDSKKSCTVYKGNEDFEDKNAYDLLLTIRDNSDPVARAVVIALVNALNNKPNLKKDKGNLFNDLKLKKGSKVAMIGYFAPIVKQLEKENIEVIAYDLGKKVGDEKEFYDFCYKNADALILTATSFINCTFANVMEKLKNFKKPVAVLGPSTIMMEELYKNTPVCILGGTQAIDNKGILKAIRNGKGTPMLHKYSKKIYNKF